MASKSFFQVITEAIRDIEAHGYDSQARIQRWILVIREAAARHYTPQSMVENMLNGMLRTVYTRFIEKDGVYKVHPGISRFTIDQMKPSLHRELERRMEASRNLIKLHREETIRKTIQRFEGWSTSVPAGGSNVVEVKEVKENLTKPLTSLPYEERRVLIDQAHKLISNINDIIALDNNALCAVWDSRWRQPGYNYRPDHKERDRKYYAIRGNWAMQKGLMKVGPAGYTDQITQPGEEPFCRCSYVYVYNLASVPDYMLTVLGIKSLERVAAQ